MLAASIERGDRVGGRCGTLLSPAPSPLPKPPEALPTPVPLFPLSECGHLLARLSRGSICQSSLETKAQGTSREWWLLMPRVGRVRLRPLQAPSGWERR